VVFSKTLDNDCVSLRNDLKARDENDEKKSEYYAENYCNGFCLRCKNDG
jgi:hypothetical protein